MTRFVLCWLCLALVAAPLAGAQSNVDLLATRAADLKRTARDGAFILGLFTPGEVAANALNGLVPSDGGYRIVGPSLTRGATICGSSLSFKRDGVGVTGGGNVRGFDVQCESLISMTWFWYYVQPLIDLDTSCWKPIRQLFTNARKDRLPFGFTPVDFDHSDALAYRLGRYNNDRRLLDKVVFPRLSTIHVQPVSDDPSTIVAGVVKDIENDEYQMSPLVISSIDGRTSRVVLAYKVADCLAARRDGPNGWLDAQAIFVMDLDPDLPLWNRPDTYCLLYFPDRGNELCLEETYRAHLDELEDRRRGEAGPWFQRGHLLENGQVEGLRAWYHTLL